jgi:L-gulonate 3-dehydrogenase
VNVYDADPSALDRAKAGIEKSLVDLKKFGLVDDPGRVVKLIAFEPKLSAALDGVEYVQENVPERLEIKQAVFKEIDALASPSAILASSSSGLAASQIAKDVSRRERCLVAHPLNPPHIVPLVEIVPAPWTSKEVVDRTRGFLKDIGKVPIVLKKEVAGFIVNRLQGVVLHEAFALVEEGCVSVEDIDLAMTEGLGLRWSVVGPFETIDLNAPNGVGDYAQRYGKMFLDFVETRGAPKPWPNQLIGAVDKSMRDAWPISEIPTRQARRDRKLMALAAHNKGSKE